MPVAPSTKHMNTLSLAVLFADTVTLVASVAVSALPVTSPCRLATIVAADESVMLVASAADVVFLPMLCL